MRGVLPTLIISGNEYSDLAETIHELVVEGYGVVDFGKRLKYASRYFYIDDLIIKNDSKLIVTGWDDSRDRFLVRRNSKHVLDSLKRMGFVGYDSSRIKLVSFNKDYWEISPLPEPSTYGAILGAVGLGFFAWRKKRRVHPHDACARIRRQLVDFRPE